MGMSKRDYQAIAGAIFEARAPRRFPETLEALDEVAGRLADVFAADSPRFDRARFLEACETGACRGMARKAPRGRASAAAETVLPLCAQAMRCLCAGHAGGLAAGKPCDTTERCR